MPAPIGLAHYFKDICMDVYETLMTKQGFACTSIDDIGGVLFTRNELFIEITYLPDTVPFVSVINLGYFICMQNMRIRKAIGIWYVIPEALADDFELWRFSNASELRISLSRLRDEVLTEYGQQLWSNSNILKNIIAKHEADLQANYQKGLLKETKVKAEKAFRDGNYSEAISLYGKVPLTELSPVEMKRIEIINKRMRL